ncbi:TPA: hypothetical protein ACH3X1_013360 [Trebouxia sp. C0004]
MMTADLTMWQALHEQDEQEKKEVVAIRFMDDLLSEKEVALLANKKATNKKNRKRGGTPRDGPPTPALHYATASCVTARTGAFAGVRGDEVTSVPLAKELPGCFLWLL